LIEVGFPDTDAKKWRCRWAFCCWKWLATSAPLRGCNCLPSQGWFESTDEETKSGCSSSVVLEKQKYGETTGERKVARWGEVGRKTFSTLFVVRTLVRWLMA
jgi:hypothetical protein